MTPLVHDNGALFMDIEKKAIRANDAKDRQVELTPKQEDALRKIAVAGNEGVRVNALRYVIGSNRPGASRIARTLLDHKFIRRSFQPLVDGDCYYATPEGQEWVNGRKSA